MGSWFDGMLERERERERERAGERLTFVEIVLLPAGGGGVTALLLTLVCVHGYC